MKLKSLTLYNYRLYKGANTFEFNNHLKTPISLVSGLNGFGKTSFVHALSWCLYGNLLVQVDDSYRKEIFSVGGYKKFLLSQMNRTNDLNKSSNNYFVKVVLQGVKLPGVLESEVVIERNFSTSNLKESLSIEIDGATNQLTEEIGYEEFINDYILPREVAKFFFFDSEKIVDLADIERDDNKRSLYSAYSKILGLSSYLDLKSTLESLIKRLSKKGLDSELFEEVKNLQKRADELHKERKSLLKDIDDVRNGINETQQKQLIYQSKIRKAGISLGSEDISNLTVEIDSIKLEINEKRLLLNNYLTYLPFLLNSHLLERIRSNTRSNNENLINEIFIQTKSEITRGIKDSGILSSKTFKRIVKEIDKINTLKTPISDTPNTRVMSGNSLATLDRIISELDLSVKSNLLNTVNEIKDLTRLERKKRAQVSEYDKYINSDNTKGTILSFRELQDFLEKQITKEVNLRTQIESVEKEINQVLLKQENLLSQAKVIATDGRKIELAQKLIVDIGLYINHLKTERKNTLEETILKTINSLSHKQWITKVVVDFSEDMLNVSLYGEDGLYIDKRGLSKGEQQMYASSILVSLITESSIDFPVIMDSPLQKLDKHHARNFITQLYPLLGSQIILLPLLDKELREDEYALMFNLISETYLIVNKNGNSMVFESPKSELYSNFRNSLMNA